MILLNNFKQNKFIQKVSQSTPLNDTKLECIPCKQSVERGIQFQNGSIKVDTVRDLPCHNLSPLFYNHDTNEISYDGSIMSYSQLLNLVNNLTTR
jgi:hypothetical protein